MTGSRRINFKDKSTVMNLVLIVVGIIFGLIMIIMGSLHADRFLIIIITIITTIINNNNRSFTDSLKSGVIYTSCSLVDRCGEDEDIWILYVLSVKNLSGCPGQPIIPWYLVIGGILTIIFLVGRIILCRVKVKLLRIFK